MQIEFSFADGTFIDYDYNLIYSINPKIIMTKSIINESGKYILKLPPKINKDDLVEFLLLYMKNSKLENNLHFFSECRDKFIAIINDNKKFDTLSEILLFFNNEAYINFLINNIFIPEMKKDKVINFLLFSYKLIELNKNNDSEISSSYFNLFNLCLEKIENDEKYLINNYEKIKILGKDRIRKIIEKIFYNLLYSKCLLNTDEDSLEESLDLIVSDKDSNMNDTSILNENNSGEIGKNRFGEDSEDNNNQSNNSNKKDNIHIINIKHFRKLISILMDISNNHNIYELLSYEYINILSQESSSYNKKNIFNKKIYLNNIKNNNLIYEEIPLDIMINNKILYFVIFFQPLEHSINVCIKLKDNKINTDNKVFNYLDDRDYCFKLFTFYVTIQITKGNNLFTTKKNKTIISLTNNKSMYNIFKSTINTEFPSEKYNNNGEMTEQYFIINAEIKLCSIYTAIISYILQDFSSFYRDENLSKLSKHLFILIINSKYLDKKNSNDIINSILIWLNDDTNIKEDISEVFYNINWDNVDEALIFELIVKYSHFIANNESLRIMFCKVFEEKYRECSMVKSIVNNIISASKNINYEQIFTQMKRNIKFNNAFINHNSFYFMNNNYNNNITNYKLNNKQKRESNQISLTDIKYNNNIIQIQNEKNKIIRKNKSNDYKFINKNNIINKNKNESKIILEDINNNKINNKKDNIKKNNTEKNNIKMIVNKTNTTKITNNFKKIKFQKPINPNLKLIIKDIKMDKTKQKKEIENNISMKKMNKPKLIKKITNKSFNKTGKIKMNLTKQSSSDFMKFVLNTNNSTFSNFYNSFNKSFNNLKKFH